MAKKLHYFHLNGLAEPIRYILHYGGQKFEDVRYAYSYDPVIGSIKSPKEILPYGQMLLYEEGDKTLSQSLAIARYLAAKVHLLPADPWEQAVLDAAALNMYDFWGKVLIFIKEGDSAKKEAIKEEIINETVDFFFSRFETELKDNNGFFNGRLSWVDFVLVGILESANLFLGIEIEQKYPTVLDLVQKIHALPDVKRYITTRKPYIL